MASNYFDFCSSLGGLGMVGCEEPTSVETPGRARYSPSEAYKVLKEEQKNWGAMPGGQLNSCLANVLSDMGYCLSCCSSGSYGYADGGSATQSATSLEKLLNIYGGKDKSNSYFELMKCLMSPGDFSELTPPTIGGSMRSARSPLELAALHQLYGSINPLGSSGGMASGGLPKHYHEASPPGHHPEFVTGHTGFYADGRGTGQSDDIPALLHDGDYVMDAETVSSLGDGSSKAGRQVLDQFRTQIPHSHATGGKVVPAQIADGEYVFPAAFVTALGGGDNKQGAKILDGLRHKLREHKRAAPINKIPPKAKSPLEYIEKAKG